NSLAGLIVLASDTRPRNKLSYHPQSRLDDEKLRLVISELQECSNAVRKADLLQAEIHSLEDLREVFNAWCIFGDEYQEIFRRLGDFELAYLSRCFEHDHPHDQEEHSWQVQLAHYLQGPAAHRCRSIAKLAAELE
ncbi:MAG TPA: hypothetical protein VHS59_06355, partial [Bacillota bacterium]|nr:hypothetical protein [Bacillota bacterium]